MILHRAGFDRVYEFCHNVAPPHLHHAASAAALASFAAFVKARDVAVNSRLLREVVGS